MSVHLPGPDSTTAAGAAPAPPLPPPPVGDDALVNRLPDLFGPFTSPPHLRARSCLLRSEEHSLTAPAQSLAHSDFSAASPLLERRYRKEILYELRYFAPAVPCGLWEEGTVGFAVERHLGES